LPRRSVWLSCRTAGGSAPPTWSSGCRWRAGSWARSRHHQALDKYQLLILDDIAYVTRDQAETSVLFELIATRYERRSLLITANQPFGEWGKIFADQAMTLAAIDRLVHHATILETNVESYRRRAGLQRKRGNGQPS
jgi:DNA replication protein DnaC